MITYYAICTMLAKDRGHTYVTVVPYPARSDATTIELLRAVIEEVATQQTREDELVGVQLSA